MSKFKTKDRGGAGRLFCLCWRPTWGPTFCPVARLSPLPAPLCRQKFLRSFCVMPSGCCCRCCCCCKIYYKTHSGRAPQREAVSQCRVVQIFPLTSVKGRRDWVREKIAILSSQRDLMSWRTPEVKALWWGYRVTQTEQRQRFPQKSAGSWPCIYMFIYPYDTDIRYAWYWETRDARREKKGPECSLNEDANVYLQLPLTAHRCECVSAPPILDRIKICLAVPPLHQLSPGICHFRLAVKRAPIPETERGVDCVTLVARNPDE